MFIALSVVEYSLERCDLAARRCFLFMADTLVANAGAHSDTNSSLNHDPLYLIEADLVAPAIVELRRTREAWFAIAAAFSSVPPFLR